MDFQDEFSFSDFRRKCPYRDLEVCKNDLLRLVVYLDHSPEAYLMKDTDDLTGKPKLSYCSEMHAKQKLNKITAAFIGQRKVTAWDILMSDLTLFTKRCIRFYSKDKRDFSYFKGYDYEVGNVNYNLIQPWLDHVKNVICDHDEEAFNYFLKWFSSILQTPDYKTGIAILIIGSQGTGKNDFFSNILAKLLGDYCNPNVNQLESLCGKFNASLENKKLIVCNEIQSIDANKYLNSDALKSLITERILNIEQKYEIPRITENVSNFIMISNNEVPLKIETSDRRYLVLHTSDEHKQDFKYFSELAKTFTKEFYESLFSFFMTMDIKDFNLRMIPITEAKKDIINASKPVVDCFVEDEGDQIIDLTGPELYDMYVCYAKRNGYAQQSKRTFIASIKKYTGESTVKRLSGELARVYNLKN